MKDDYLWDGSGEPDPEILRLETVLAKYRHSGQAPAFPETTGAVRSLPRRRILFAGWSIGLAAAAAAIILALATFGPRYWVPDTISKTRPGWDVERVAGTPRVGWKSIGKKGETGRLGIGQTLETDSYSRATISVSEIGEVRVEPNTRLRLVTRGPGHNRLSLERGTIHAAIWAPPGDFVVDTPSAMAVDLGCAYTLQVDDSGAGLLRTTLGWVGFRLDKREAFIPAGAACKTRPKIGPGTPYFEDASESFQAALSKFDFGAITPDQRNAELSFILAESRKRDALTVWHLLARVSESERGRVYDRLAALVPPPSGVTRDGILRLDQQMLDLWWNALDLGDVSLWRIWERTGFPSKVSEK